MTQQCKHLRSEPLPASHRGRQELQPARLAGADLPETQSREGLRRPRPQQVGRQCRAGFMAARLLFPNLKSEQGDLDTVPTDAVFLFDSVLTQHQKVMGVCNGNVMHALLKGPRGSIETACRSHLM